MSVRPHHVRRAGGLVLGLALLGSAASAQEASGLAASRTGGEEVVISLDPELPVAGLNADVEALFAGEDPPTAVSLFYRRTGQTGAFTELVGVQDTSDPRVFRGRLPGSALTPSGLDVFVRYVRRGETLTQPPVNPEAFPIRFPVVVAQLAADVRLTPREYRMVSVPLQFPEELRDEIEDAGLVLGGTVDGVFGNDDGYGDYDPNRWRILRWDPAAEAYREGPEEIGAFAPGRAVWLANALGAGFVVDAGVGAGVLITASGPQPMRVVLEPGWNQIGSPFPYPVAWDDVAGSDLVEEPVRYERGEYRRDVGVLIPWEGYFVYNQTGAPVTLTFEPVAADASVAAPPFAERLLRRAGAGAYLLQLDAEANGGQFRDRDNYVGVAAEARMGRDALDRSEAPPIGEGLRLSVLDGEAARAVSVRPAGEGQVWDVELNADGAPSGLLGRPVTVALREYGDRPAGADLFVLDLDAGAAADVRGGRFTVRFGDTPQRRFRLILGSPAYAGTHADGLPLWPEGPALEPPYPNPVGRSGAATLAYRVGRLGPARLVVYDLLGRAVRDLLDAEVEPGWHEVVWDGLDAGGQALAPGVYLAVLRAPGGSVTQKLTLLR